LATAPGVVVTDPGVVVVPGDETVTPGVGTVPANPATPGTGATPTQAPSNESNYEEIRRMIEMHKQQIKELEKQLPENKR
ncbi:MAG: hypothetical protein K2H18_03985, partial [Muribaculaceae bacterium]|nr:hypothetical protein [Muribaculaceae bacterium]